MKNSFKKKKEVLKEKRLIRKVPFIPAFKSFTFRKMRRTPGKARWIKYSYLTGEKVLIFEIKSADRTEWTRWYLDMSVGDEMRAQKITFILCIDLSLKTSLNPTLPGERHLAWLGIKCHLFLAVWWVFLQNVDIFKPGPDPGRTVRTNMPEEHEGNDVTWDDEKSFMWLTACVLFCRSGGGAGEGWVKMHFLFPSIN